MKVNKGFTLVELISVISLLLVLSVLAVVAYSNITDAARKAAISSDANTLARALNAYNSIVYSDRIAGGQAILVNDDVFPLIVVAGVNGPIDLDLSVVVGPGRGNDVLEVLTWVSSTSGTGGMWVVEMDRPPSGGTIAPDGTTGITTGPITIDWGSSPEPDELTTP